MSGEFSIAIAESQVFGSNYSHTTGVLMGPDGPVATIEAQPNSSGTITIGPRSGSLGEVRDIVTGLSQEEAQAVFSAASDAAANTLDDRSYEIPDSVRSFLGLIGQIVAGTPMPSTADLLGDLLGRNDYSTQNSNAFGRTFHDQAISEAQERDVGSTSPLSTEDFTRSVPGWGYTENFGYIDPNGFISAPYPGNDGASGGDEGETSSSSSSEYSGETDAVTSAETAPSGFGPQGTGSVSSPDPAVSPDGFGQAVGGPGDTNGSGWDGSNGDPDANDPRGNDYWPVILDLDGDGIEIRREYSAFFDVDADGFREQTAWAAPDDGFLVLDLNADGTRGTGDGQIDQARELAFALWGDEGDTDLQGLKRAFDGNNDDVLNAYDDVWVELRVWQDLDQDGEADDGELRTLADWGITEINLGYDDGSDYAVTDDDITIFGNTLHGLASYTRNGAVIEGGVGDVSLAASTLGWRRVETTLGYDIELEAGVRLQYAELDGSGDAHLNFSTLVLDGAVGDARNNQLHATGHSRSVQIHGGDGNDQVYGGENNDQLIGGSGVDDLRGHGGNDLLIVDASDLTDGTVSGGDGVDTLIVTGTTGVSVNLGEHDVEAAFGSEGGDSLWVSNSWDLAAIYGREGADTISGSNGDDRLIGGEGNDQVSGGVGVDFISGGDGADSLFGGDGDDLVLGGLGSDSLDGANGDDQLNGGDGDDTLFGNQHDDTLIGGAGNDELNGGWGDDSLIGGDGDDTLSVWRGDDHLIGGDGSDVFRVQGGGTYGTSPAVGWAILQGGAGNDLVEIDASSTDYSVRQINDHQWQLVRHTGPIISTLDVQDIETVTFSNGVSLSLNSDTTLDTSDDYVRDHYSDFVGDGDFFTRSAGDFGHLGSRLVPPDEPGSDPLTESFLEFTYNDTHLKGWTGNDTLLGHETLDDLIDGGEGSDVIRGLGGNDTLNGHSGEDQIFGGNGNDQVNGGSGADALVGDEGNDTLDGQQGSDRIWGEDGDDLLLGGSGADALIGGVGDDDLSGHDGNDDLYGGEGQDTLTGGTGSDRLFGHQDADSLEGNEGADLLLGGDGNDTLSGQEGSDIVHGENGNDSINGGESNDWLTGGDGADTLSGGSGRDVLIGGGGADHLDGGIGILDAVSYAGSSAAVSVDLFTNAAAGGDAQGDVISNFENLVGSDHNDTLTGNAIDNIVSGGDGDDLINGAAGHDALSGGEGSDTISAGIGNDRVWGHAGADELNGGDGSDNLDGGDGNDTITGGADGATADSDTLDGGAGDDHLSSGQATTPLAGRQDNGDHLFGRAGQDTLIGGTANDILEGGEDADSLVGGGGNDALTGGKGADTLEGGTGADTALYTASGQRVFINLLDGVALWGEAAGDQLTSIENVTGSAYGDRITGDTGSNVLKGLAGGDYLFGGDGDDSVYGGEGGDHLFGGAGNDLLVGYEAGLEEATVAPSTTPELWISANSWGHWESQAWVAGDFDGSGTADILAAYDDGQDGTTLRFYASNGTSFASPSAWATGDWGFYTSAKWNSGDFDGDGRDDVISAYRGSDDNSVLRVYLSDGSSFSSPAAWSSGQWAHYNSAAWTSGDYNGDGKDDIAATYANGTTGDSILRIYYSNGSGFDAPTGYHVDWGHWASQDWVSGDFDGDGKEDILSAYGLSDGKVALRVYTSTGSGFDAPSNWAGGFSASYDAATEWKTGDYNGDGKDDLAAVSGSGSDTSVHVYLSTGSGFAAPVVASNDNGFAFASGQDWVSADFTADAVDDIAVASKSDNGDTVIRVYTSNSNGDVLSGGSGDDTLIGGAGNDTLIGGAGADVFEFGNDFGADVITDFSTSQAGEIINLSDVTQITSFSDLTGNHLSQSGSDAIVSDGNGNSITLSGVNAADLTTDDFLF